MNTQWSKPYFGVQHFLGIPRSHQITVTDHGAFAEVYQLHLHSLHPFTDQKREVRGTAEEARKIGEAWASTL